MIEFFANEGDTLLRLILEHIGLSLISLGLGVLVAVPLGIILSQFPKIANVVIGIASVLQTVPTLALLALMVPLLGVGAMPAIVALFIYSLLPILRNTYLGMADVDPNLLVAAKGMGMSTGQVIQKVQLPMAVPVIMAGIRLSAVYVIAWTTIASYIGGGGLGDFIFNGLQTYRQDLIFGGTIPVIIIAIVMDFGFGYLEKRLSPQTRSEVNTENA
jgi:osmoprotectant transport system permease protein